MKTFSIGIPIYNEEENIARLINSIKDQELSEFVLDEVVLYNDGSNDNTELVIKKLVERDEWMGNIITYFNSEENRGKTHGLNRIFKHSKSDFLVLIDSDMVLEKKNAIETLLIPLSKNKSIGLTSGWYRLSDCASNIGKAIKFSLRILKKIGKEKNLYRCSGAIMALTKDLVVGLVLPEKMIRDDAFLYFYNKKKGNKYFFNKKVSVTDTKNFSSFGLVWFASAQKRNERYPNEFYRDFESEVIKVETKISLFKKFKVFLSLFILHPVEGLFYIFYKTASFGINYFNKNKADYLWRK